MDQGNNSLKHFKVVIIGKSAVGKSCLLVRFVEDRFDTNYLSTIGVDFQFKTFNIKAQKYRLDIWDTAGQERYSVIIFYKSIKNLLTHIRQSQKHFTKMPKEL